MNKIKVNMRGLDGYTALIRACFERFENIFKSSHANDLLQI